MKNKKAVLSISGKIIYVVLFLISFIFQFNFFPRLGIEFPVFLLIPLTVTVAMHEREFSGLLFGLFAGALWDIASPLPDGSLAFIFAVFACIIGLLIHYVLRNTLLSALLLSIIFNLIYCLYSHLFSMSGFDYEFTKALILTHYFPALLFSFIITIPDYFLIRTISKFIQTEKI